MSSELAPYLPAPHLVALADEHTPSGLRYHLDYDCPQAIGKLRAFLGNLAVVLRAYAWTMSLGARGLREVAEIAVINNNYLEAQLREIRGIGYPYAAGIRRLDQIRYSFGELKEDTGFGTEDMRTRFCDFGVQTWFMSHHPWIVPEPFTPEPCETYSKEDIDYWAAAMKATSDDAYKSPQYFAAAPHNQSCHRIRTWERLEDRPGVGGHLACLPAQACRSFGYAGSVSAADLYVSFSPAASHVAFLSRRPMSHSAFCWMSSAPTRCTIASLGVDADHALLQDVGMLVAHEFAQQLVEVRLVSAIAVLLSSFPATVPTILKPTMAALRPESFFRTYTTITTLRASTTRVHIWLNRPMHPETRLGVCSDRGVTSTSCDSRSNV